MAYDKAKLVTKLVTKRIKKFKITFKKRKKEESEAWGMLHIWNKVTVLTLNIVSLSKTTLYFWYRNSNSYFKGSIVCF